MFGKYIIPKFLALFLFIWFFTGTAVAVIIVSLFGLYSLVKFFRQFNIEKPKDDDK